MTVTNKSDLCGYKVTVTNKSDLCGYKVTVTNKSDLCGYKVTVTNKSDLCGYKVTVTNKSDLYSYKKQFLDYIESIRNNCSVLNESFDGYVILEDKLKSVDLASLFSYKYTSSSSSFSDNTPETPDKLKSVDLASLSSYKYTSSSSFSDNTPETPMEDKPVRTIVRGVNKETNEYTEQDLAVILDRMNNPDWYNEDGTRKKRLIIKDN